MNPQRSHKKAHRDDSFSLLRMTPILFLVACFALAVFFLSSSRRKQENLRKASEPAPAAETKIEKPGAPEAKPFVVAPERRASSAPVAKPPQQDYPFVPAEKLIERFAALQGITNALTLSQIEMIDQTLKQLTVQGATSIPAIAAYLESLSDFNLQSHGLLGQPTLRAGLLQALSDIGGPEAVDLIAKTLQNAADPYEIGLTAALLEQHAPGQYRNDVIEAARESLAMAQRGELGGRDVAPLFQALQNAGAPEARAQIEGSASNWNYYGVMALAGLQDGSGISTLVQQTQQAGASDSADTRFAWQMLAQYSGQNAEAQAALLNAAQANSVPASAWPKIITGLTGDQYMYGDPRTGGERLSAVTGLKTYHIRVGNQNFFSLPLASLNPPDMAARRSVIDALLRFDLPAETLEMLRQGRNSLSGFATNQ